MNYRFELDEDDRYFEQVFNCTRFCIPPPVEKKRDKNMCEIEEGLWLGCASDAKNVQNLMEKNIDLVITIRDRPLSELTLEKFEIRNVKYIHYFLDDDDDDRILDVCKKAHELLLKSHYSAEHSALIHCQMGISRSAAVLAYHLMMLKNIDFQESLQIIRKKRCYVNPNSYFRDVLNNVIINQ